MLAPDKKISVERKVVRAACPHDCPDTCAMKITVENGVAVKVEGAKDHPFTAGAPQRKEQAVHAVSALEVPRHQIGRAHV